MFVCQLELHIRTNRIISFPIGMVGFCYLLGDGTGTHRYFVTYWDTEFKPFVLKRLSPLDFNEAWEFYACNRYGMDVLFLF